MFQVEFLLFIEPVGCNMSPKHTFFFSPFRLFLQFALFIICDTVRRVFTNITKNDTVPFAIKFYLLFDVRTNGIIIHSTALNYV